MKALVNVALLAAAAGAFIFSPAPPTSLPSARYVPGPSVTFSTTTVGDKQFSSEIGQAYRVAVTPSAGSLSFSQPRASTRVIEVLPKCQLLDRFVNGHVEDVNGRLAGALGHALPAPGFSLVLTGNGVAAPLAHSSAGQTSPLSK
jgi:hypothetical protein